MIEELGTTDFIYLFIYLMSQRVKIASKMGLCVFVSL